MCWQLIFHTSLDTMREHHAATAPLDFRLAGTYYAGRPVLRGGGHGVSLGGAGLVAVSPVAGQAPPPLGEGPFFSLHTISDMSPAAQGLYDPEFEHDACGLGFVAHIKGTRSHE